MHKIVYILLIAIFVVGGIYFYINYVQTGLVNRGVELFEPTKKDIKNYLPLGYNLNLPIRILPGFRLGVYADLGGSKPRVLALDPSGVIVASLTSDGKVVALVDKNGDGISDETVDILKGLNQPHGILFNSGYLYVAETDKVSRYLYNKNTYSASGKKVLFDLPGGGNHFTRTIKVIDNKLYTSVGSTCNVCEESNDYRASILVSDLDGSNLKVFAKGLRNTVFFVPDGEGNIWGNDMGRDQLGDNLPPDELNKISLNASDGSLDYGWPYCYGKKIRDSKFMSGQETSYCASTQLPVYEYPAHVAPLGLTFIHSDMFEASDQGDVLVALHGSWNSSVPVGYKIVKLDIFAGEVVGMTDFISGFIQDRNVIGRPVDLLFNNAGNLFISDDKSGLIYILSKE